MINKNFNIILLCGIFPQEMKDFVFKNTHGNIQTASDKLQKAYIDGFVTNGISNIYVLNIPFIGTFPRSFNYPFLKSRNILYPGVLKFYSGSLVNLPLISNYWKYLQYKVLLKKCLNDIDNNYPTIMIGYSATYAISKIISKYSNSDSIQSWLIIPDLPQYMTFSKMSKIKKNLISNFLVKPVLNDINKINNFVVLTKYFIDYLPNSTKNMLIIEGMYNINNTIDNEIRFDIKDKRSLLYTGSTEIEYGIIDFINFFIDCNLKNFELIICGSGNASDMISEIAKNHSNIKYYGLINEVHVTKLQHSVDFLINPRKNNSGIFTKYSFPSKIIEYMASGTPVIMNKLDGIPDEYYDYCYILDETSDYNYKKSFLEIIGISKIELTKKGASARKFIIENKSSYVQISKLLGKIEENIFK